MATCKGLFVSPFSLFRFAVSPVNKVAIYDALLKGLTYMFPPTPLVEPQCSLNLVLSLMCTPFKTVHCCSFRQLTLNIVFLISITSMPNGGELQPLSVQPPYITFFPAKLVLRLGHCFCQKWCHLSILLSATFL